MIPYILIFGEFACALVAPPLILKLMIDKKFRELVVAAVAQVVAGGAFEWFRGATSTPAYEEVYAPSVPIPFILLGLVTGLVVAVVQFVRNSGQRPPRYDDE